MTTLRDFAERVLFGQSLEEKLAAPPPGLLDEARGRALVTPPTPGRPSTLRLASADGERAEFPREHQLVQESARGQLLHFLANHELLATELMALALLKFPDSPPAFRRGLLQTLAEEQIHTQWYLDRMADYGVHFGDLPVNGFFWKAVSPMETPMDYVTRLPLTFEQANLDFSLHYRDIFRRAGDETAARLFQSIHDDEISHVAYGLNWFRKWKEPGETDWEGLARRLVFPLSPVRAKARQLVDRDGRLKAGLDLRFIGQLDLCAGSRGRTPVVYVFNPQAEMTVRDEVPDRPILRLAEDLDLLPILLGHREDVVLVRRRPSLEHLEKLRRQGIDAPEFEVVDTPDRLRPDSLLAGRKLGGLRPWAWSPDAEAMLAPLRTAMRAASAAGSWEPRQRALYSKAFGAEILAALGDPLAGQSVHSLAELHQAMRELERAGHHHGVVKPAFGTSGRGFRRTERFQPTDDTWAESVIQSHGALVVEPWLDRLADFSVQGEVLPDGRLRLKGLTHLITDERGRFVAVESAGRLGRLLPPAVARFLGGGRRGNWIEDYYRERVFPVLNARFSELGFSGAFGIDALIYRAADGSPALRPVVEINPRHTMGRVALEARRFAHSASIVRFSLATLRSARTHGCRSLPELAGHLESRRPVRLVQQGATEVIAEGTVVLNEAHTAQRFLAVLEIKPATPAPR